MNKAFFVRDGIPVHKDPLFWILVLMAVVEVSVGLVAGYLIWEVSP